MWTCPKCGTKVDPSFEVCWKCGTTAEGVEDPTFVPADESGPIEDPMYDPISDPHPALKEHWSSVQGDAHQGELVSCYQALSLMEAKFLADQLSEQGIPAVSDTQDLQDALGTWEGNPRVYCRASDYPQARAFLAEYEAKKRRELGEHMSDSSES